MWQQGAAAGYTSIEATFLYAPKNTSCEESSVNMKMNIQWCQRSPCRTTRHERAGFFSFCYLNDKVWSYFEENRGRLIFTFWQIWTSQNHNFHNLQPILDCIIPKFKLKHQQLKAGKTKLGSWLVSLLFLWNPVEFDSQRKNVLVKQPI